MWLDYKREHELTPARMSPTPLEYHLYYDM
jgi:hypothetical protein